MRLVVVMGFLITASILMISCTKKNDTPENLLKMYVKDVTSANVDKDYFLKYTTGDLKAAIEEMSEEDFDFYSKDLKVDSAKVNILTKTCENIKCIVKYVVKFKTKTEESGSFESEVKKFAEIVKEDDGWKISEVTNIKTFHEAKTPIEVKSK